MARQSTIQPKHSEFVGRFRHLGLRVTPARLLVMEALSAHGGHMTAEEIMLWTSARYPAINLATIYRTLDLLTSMGLVTQTDLGSGASSYELVGDTLHHHLVCQQCGTVMEVDDAALTLVRERLLRDFGFRAAPGHMAIFGTCKGCLDASHHTITPTAPR